MKFLYEMKWKRKTEDKWHYGLTEDYHYIKPGETIHDSSDGISICEKPYKILFAVYPTIIEFWLDDITSAIKYASSQELIAEAAELIEVAKELGIEEEPQIIRL